MSGLIKGSAQQRWVREAFAIGFQQAITAALARREPFSRAYRYFCLLEDRQVIMQWAIVDDSGSVHDIVDPDTGAPLMVAAERWNEFASEATALGLLEQRT